MSNTVGDVGKAFGKNRIKVVEHAVLDNLAVKRRNAVYAVRADNREVCHTCLIIAENAHTRDLFG